MFKRVKSNDGESIYVFELGDKALIRRNRYRASTKTPAWADFCCCEVVKYNKKTAHVKVDGYGDEICIVDIKDLMPTPEELRHFVEKIKAQDITDLDASRSDNHIYETGIGGNDKTLKVIEDVDKGIDLSEPFDNVDDLMKALND